MKYIMHITKYITKYIMFDLKKYRGVIFHDTEELTFSQAEL